MALMSEPILVADSTSWSFAFSHFMSSVNVQVRFYTDLAATEDSQLLPVGTGSRDVTATATSSAYSGNFNAPTDTQRVTAAIYNGTLIGLPDGTVRPLGLGSGVGQINIVAAPNSTPGTAVTYRIHVEAEGRSFAT